MANECSGDPFADSFVITFEDKRPFAHIRFLPETHHGPATCRYHPHGGGIFHAHDVLLPDGDRGYAENIPYGHAWRRPVRGWPTHWIWGTVTITANDIVFVDDPTLPRVDLQFRGALVMEPELLKHRALRIAARDFISANCLFSVLLNDFQRPDLDDRQWFSHNDAAQCIADLRSQEEYYLDFAGRYRTPTYIDRAIFEERCRSLIETIAEVGWIVAP